MAYKVVFCGTPAFAVSALKTLVENPDFEVPLVLSQPDRPAGRGKKLRASEVKTFALEHGLEVITPEKARAPEIIDRLAAIQADIGVVVAYGQILPQEFFDQFRYGCVNIHGSLLPRWRGAAPIQRALMAGDRETGVSLQVMVLKLDAGAVIGERKIQLLDEWGARELYRQLSDLGADMLKSDLVDFLKGQKTPVPQDESQVTIAKKIEKVEGQIRWSETAEAIHNKIRGLNMGGPFAVTSFRDKSLKIHRSKVAAVTSSDEGRIIAVGKNDFTVACGDKALQIFELQPESKARMTAGDFIRGFQVKEGEVLGESV